jgi:cytidylate kinase
MTREMGSLGKDVAAALAARTNRKVVYQEIIEPLANKMRLRKSHVERFLEGKSGIWERLTTDKTSLSIYTAGEILDKAKAGAVLRGWGAVHLLNPVRHAIRVRVCAPFELRVHRMMERLDSDDYDSVAGEIRASDEAQSAITRRHFALDWQAPENYDLTLNTERMSPDQCADEILWLSKDPEFKETAASRAVLEDLALQARAKAALRSDAQTRELKFPVEVRERRVKLVGVIDTRAERDAVVRVVSAVPGVQGVDNELRVAADIHRPVRE